MKRDFFKQLQCESNSGILNYLKKGWNKHPRPVCCSPDEIKNPGKSLWTHPELIDWLWNTLQAKVPIDCKHVLFGKPVLIHPETLVVFGFGHGDSACALRLPMDRIEIGLGLGMQEDVELANGTRMYSEDIGDDWIFCGWTEDDPDWCLRAFEYAASINRQLVANN